MTAAELISKIENAGGRVLRMKAPPNVFVLTDNFKLAQRLVDRGASQHHGNYKRARDGRDEWDLWIHPIPVLGEETVWEVAGKERPRG